jgi:valine--pyruvate aminotransferase
MRYRLSRFGDRFSRRTGSLELMHDLGNAMSGERPALMLGGGNPGRIPAVEAIFRQRLAEISADDAEFGRLLANYAHPKGEHQFRRSLAKLINEEYGWGITADNIVLTAGSQMGFFLLFNMLAGLDASGTRRQVLLPLTPEYVGYSDLGIEKGLFAAQRPLIEELPDDYYKYHIDFERLEIDERIGAVCVSRPTNPTGNMLTDDELRELSKRCEVGGVPLIVDNAYGLPFPHILFVDASPIWNDNIVYCLSLSKIGLPAARTGIVIGNADIVEAMTNMTAVTSLAVGSVGATILQPLVEDGSILRLCREEIMPFYRDKAMRAADWLRKGLNGLPFKIHRPEGAFFLWLWLPGLPITSAELYRRLKQAGTFVLSGHYFFPGLEETWEHRDECLRISFAQDDATVEQGIRAICSEVRRAYLSGESVTGVV